MVLICDLKPLESALVPVELGEHAALALIGEQGKLALSPGRSPEGYPDDLLSTALVGKARRPEPAVFGKIDRGACSVPGPP